MTLTFDLLTWMSIGIIFSSRTIYLQSLKLQGQSVPELSVAQGLRDWHDLWPCDLTINRDHVLIKDYLSTYQVWSFWGKALLSYPMHKVWKTDMTFDLELWPIDLTINRDHLLIKDYLPTKFEACGANSSRTVYLPILKLVGQSVVELSVAQGLEDWHDLWPTDLTINRDHLLIKDYLPTKFEASGAKRCWVIRCTRFERLKWPLTFTFDLLTWLSIGSIYSSRTIYLPSLKLLDPRTIYLPSLKLLGPRTIYLPSLKLLGQSVLELSVAQG